MTIVKFTIYYLVCRIYKWFCSTSAAGQLWVCSITAVGLQHLYSWSAAALQNVWSTLRLPISNFISVAPLQQGKSRSALSLQKVCSNSAASCMSIDISHYLHLCQWTLQMTLLYVHGHLRWTAPPPMYVYGHPRWPPSMSMDTPDDSPVCHFTTCMTPCPYFFKWILKIWGQRIVAVRLWT